MMHKIKQFLPYLFFPCVMGAGLYCGFLVSNSNIENIIVKGSPIVFASMLVIAVLERLFPYRNDWNKSQNDIKNDTIHLFVTQIFIGRLMQPIWTFVLAGLVAFFAAKFGSNLWPHHWNLFEQLLLALAIEEFGSYWVHRWAHEVPWLWKLHAIHHSPKRLYFLNATRFHPIEKVISLIPETVPFIILGTNPACLLMYGIFNSIGGLFQHSNIRLKLGWLNYIFSLSELHRWHHSKVISESNSNYGNNLILWDIIFGTFFWPKEKEIKEIGLINPEYPEGYFSQLQAPFKGDIDKPTDFYTNPDKYKMYEH